MADQWLLCVVEGQKFTSDAFADGRYHLVPPGGEKGHDRDTGIRYVRNGGTWLPDLDVAELDGMVEK